MKLDEIIEFISEEFNIYAFEIGGSNDEIVNLILHGVREPDTTKLIEYLKEKGIKYSYEESSNKLFKRFVFTEIYVEDNKIKRKLYVSL